MSMNVLQSQTLEDYSLQILKIDHNQKTVPLLHLCPEIWSSVHMRSTVAGLFKTFFGKHDIGAQHSSEKCLATRGLASNDTWIIF